MASVPGCRSARQSRAGARGCLTARSQSRRQGAARPTVRFPSVRPASRATGAGRGSGGCSWAAGRSGLPCQAVVAASARARRGAGGRFSQGEGCSARDGAAGLATAEAAEPLDVGGGARDGAGGTGERRAAAGGPASHPCAGAPPAPARPGLGQAPRSACVGRGPARSRCSRGFQARPGGSERGRPLPARAIVRSGPAGASGVRARRPERPLRPVAAAPPPAPSPAARVTPSRLGERDAARGPAPVPHPVKG